MPQIEVADTIAGMDVVAKRMDTAARQITELVALAMQDRMRILAPKGTLGNSTNPPGDLARSVDIEGPASPETGRWITRVGPTVIYARQREFGGHIRPKVKGALAFTKFGVRYIVGPRVFTHRAEDGFTFWIRKEGVYQVPQPYVKPAYDMEKDHVWETAYKQVREALVGAR